MIITEHRKGGHMKNIHEEVTLLCENLDMPLYQRILLIGMVCRKVEHPEEKIDELIDKATNSTVPKQYKKQRKKNCMRVSVDRERQRLEEELHDCENLPEELFKGDIVENTVKYYYGAVCGVE